MSEPSARVVDEGESNGGARDGIEPPTCDFSDVDSQTKKSKSSRILSAFLEIAIHGCRLPLAELR